MYAQWDPNFSGGDGSTDDPYQITTAEQLDYIRNDLGSCYKLMSNIDLTAYLSEISLNICNKSPAHEQMTLNEVA